MDKNTVLAMNNIIYQIYNMKDFETLKKELLTSLRTLIPCECASILMADGECNDALLRNPVCVPERYIEMENRYLLVEKHDYGRWLMQRRQTTIIRASAMMDEKERVNTELYRSCFAPFGLHYSVDVTIIYHGKLLGILALYRSQVQGDFTDEEIFVLENLSDHLNIRFHNEADSKEASTGIMYMGGLIEKYGFTAREAEILSLIFDSKKNEEICGQLCISPNTLKKHLQNIYRKAGVSSRIRLMKLQGDAINYHARQ